MPVPPEAVWAALATPAKYGYWVVGSKTIRDADPSWPKPGSRFHHTVGIGPFEVSDHTEAIAAERPRLLRLRAKSRPVGTALVTLELAPVDAGTLVRMSERPDGAFAPLALNPAVHLFTRARNAESLMRLEELALIEAERALK